MSLFRPTSIGGKLLLTFLAVLLLSSGSLGITAVHQASMAVTEQVEQALRSMATDAGKIVRARMDTRLATLAEVAQHPDLQALDERALNYLETATARLDYMGMGWVDRAGIAHYADGSSADLSDRDYIRRGFQGESNLSDVIISRAVNLPVIMLATPLRDHANGQVKGLIIARMDASLLSDITDDLGFGKQGYAFILNQDGALIADRDRKRVLEQHQPLAGGHAEASRAYHEMQAGRSGVSHLIEAQRHYVVGYQQVPGTQWKLGVTAEQGEVFQRLNHLQWMLAFLSLGSIALGMVLAWSFCQRTVVRPLKHIMDVVSRIQQTGDLTLKAHVRGQDEVATAGLALNGMVDRFRTLIASISDSTGQLFAASEQLKHSSASLLEQSTQQGDMTMSVATALEEMSYAIHEVASNTANASEKAERAVQEVTEGRSTVEAEQATMSELTRQVVQSEDIVAQLNSRTEEIDEVLTIITGIADQTNLLALNAAIEAARAGEHGRGFAVVADEVRSLAGNSQSAAGTIREKIVLFRNAAQEALDHMHHCRTFTQQGMESSRQSTQSFQMTASSADEILGLNQQIATATEEQSTVIDELNLTVDQLNTGIREVNAQARETSTASFHLAELAQLLRREASYFKV
ncbi:methyl-accepting chemotaxis protein [Stutzerimonas kirkiae]|uniref:Methyl-accepting chemotaxis protein n=1 Tax=Stutzerimonas kirkiae TaxID=2211392 RepID=A0A4Q9R2C3_9GAMM|nr:methyl-accepting chemotaxis protein [Stutzerimonas kirkiae]TBU92617.1 hypothetical protein DNJ96_14790 [Stutzerimonas kirkiae]TBV00809.1 hypothetical protein DNJ95_13675 [Stutzerimonas kirkiae]TBV08700.1 hypothetical protein DNK08_10180 [Stutzerimonas kirkiae]TBV11516.1 hypothetical protein DNK01_16345 [Stutzerimonas kirkiae]